MRDHAAGATDSGRCNGQTVLGNHNIFRDKDKVKNTYKHAIHVTDYDDRTKNERVLDGIKREKQMNIFRYFFIFTLSMYSLLLSYRLSLILISFTGISYVFITLSYMRYLKIHYEEYTR